MDDDDWFQQRLDNPPPLTFEIYHPSTKTPEGWLVPIETFTDEAAARARLAILNAGSLPSGLEYGLSWSCPDDVWGCGDWVDEPKW